MLPRIVTRSSSVCQPRPTASRTGVPARPRTPTPGPDHPGGLTSFSKSDALLVETDLSKRAHYNKEVSPAPNLSKPITKASFLKVYPTIYRNASVQNPIPCHSGRIVHVPCVFDLLQGPSPFSQHTHNISPYPCSLTRYFVAAVPV